VLAAQMPVDSTGTMKRIRSDGSVDGRLAVQMKVNGNMASTARISADSALALVLPQVSEGGRVDGAELFVNRGQLLYKVNIVPNGKNTVRKFWVDAMTGIVQKDKTLGGLNASVKKHQQHTKEKNNDRSVADTMRTP
jgi:uncharacterized membrane protein YkoI